MLKNFKFVKRVFPTHGAQLYTVVDQSMVNKLTKDVKRLEIGANRENLFFLLLQKAFWRSTRSHYSITCEPLKRYLLLFLVKCVNLLHLERLSVSSFLLYASVCFLNLITKREWWSRAIIESFWSAMTTTFNEYLMRQLYKMTNLVLRGHNSFWSSK